MKKRLDFIVFILVLVTCINLISAQPPFQQITFDEGLILEAPMIEVIQQNNSFEFHVHVHNTTTGFLKQNDTTSCLLHLYQPSDGEHVFEGDMKFSTNSIDFSKELSYGNFTEEGQYAVLIYCNTSEVGGFVEYPVLVTNAKFSITTSRALIYILILSLNILLIILFLLLSIKLPYKNITEQTREGEAVTKITKVKYVKLISIWICGGSFIWLITIATGMVNNFIAFEPLKQITTSLYLFSYTGFYALSVVLIWFIFLNLWRDIILNKVIIREGKALINELK